MKTKLFLLAWLVPFLLKAQTQTLVLQPGSEGKDAVVFNYPSDNLQNRPNGDTPAFWAWAWSFGGIGGVYRSLIEFDLSQLPQNATIQSAKLTLYADNFQGVNISGHSNYNHSNKSVLKRIIAPWQENIVTWNTQPATTATGQINLPQSTTGTQNYTLDVTTHIADMYQNPSSNYGFMLQLQEEYPLAGLLFASSDFADAAKHPKLEISYTINSPKYLVPDAAFRTALKSAYPTCFEGDSLVIRLARAATMQSLHVAGKGISSLEGIAYFSNLKNLNCSYNNLSVLPTLPEGLVTLDASHNCFCPLEPVKPASISETAWIVAPNKASCMVHMTVTEHDVTTITNEPVTLKAGKSLSFDGVDDYITLPGMPASSGPYTIELWAKPSRVPSMLQQLKLNNLTSDWNHFAFVKTSAAAPLQIYVNAQLKYTNDALRNAAANSLMAEIAGPTYKGQMNDVKAWTIARTETELKSSMFSFSDYANPYLAGAWKMNAHSGTVIKDFSTRGNNGTVHGAVWINEDNSYSFQWNPATHLSTSQGRNVVFKSPLTGTFNYTVTATRANGCKATQNVKVKVNNDPDQPGKSFNDPIDLGVLSPTRRSARDTAHIQEPDGLTIVHYTFTVHQTATAFAVTSASVQWDRFYSTIRIYDANFKQLTRGVGIARLANLAPGKYYMEITPYLLDYIENVTDDVITEIGATFCPPASNISNPIVISNNAGSCFSYTDRRHTKYCDGDDYGYRGSPDLHYRITLPSAQQLTVSACGSDEYLTIYILDHAGNAIKPADFGGYTEYCQNWDNYYKVLNLPAGTYYFVTEFDEPRIEGNVNLTVTTSCPSLRTETAGNSGLVGQVSLYPNPASGKTMLNLPGLSGTVPVRITDISGKTVQTFDAGTATEISTENLTEGLYFVTFTYQDKIITEKLRVRK